MKETFPPPPDFESRRTYIQNIKEGVLIESEGATLKVKSVDNEYFPHWIYATNVETGESKSVRLVDGFLPTIIEATPSIETPALSLGGGSSEATHTNMEAYMQEAALATGDPMFGLLVKLYTTQGMSSQLILRSGERARGEITDFLPESKNMKRLGTLCAYIM